MTKKLPKCAWCGKTLKPPRIMIDLPAKEGCPTIGWCGECAPMDLALQDIINETEDVALWNLDKIRARGEGRVT